MNHTDYYVYAHRDLNGVVFYIGKGRLKRAYTNNGRSFAWKEKTKEGYTVEILYSNLTAEQAHTREKESIERPESDWSLLNKRLPSKTKPLEQKELLDLLVYDETSPTLLRWKVDRFSGTNMKVKFASAGDVAGGEMPDANGYTVIGLFGKIYKIHRVIFTLLRGNIPEGYVINHKDGNRANNLIGNIEICTIAENTRRTKFQRDCLRHDNLSGVTGVYKLHTKDGHTYFVANWVENYKNMHKCFPVHKLGETEAFRLACEYRKQMIEKLNSEGAGYSIAG